MTERDGRWYGKPEMVTEGDCTMLAEGDGAVGRMNDFYSVNYVPNRLQCYCLSYNNTPSFCICD